MVLIMLAGVMFPLWPVKLRIGVWYLSILALGLLGALIVLAVVRLIFWCVTVVVCKKAIWMFPNLFEDVGFVSLVFNLLVSIPIPVFDICMKMGKEEKRVTVRIQEKDQDKGTIKCSPDHILILHLVPLPLDSIHRSLNLHLNSKTRLISSLNPSSQSGRTTNQNKRRKKSSPVQVNDPQSLLEERNLPGKKERQVKDRAALRLYRLLLV